MECPSCHGTCRNLIEPGYWECCSLLTKVERGWVHSGGGMIPVSQTTNYPCRYRYHEAAAGQDIRDMWLTPEKFLALAAAEGNPGLQTWTVEVPGQVTQAVKSRWRTTNIVVDGVVRRYEMRGWPLYAVNAILRDDGHVHSSARSSDTHEIKERMSISERTVKWDDPCWGKRRGMSQELCDRGLGGEERDLILRRTAESWGVLVSPEVRSSPRYRKPR